MVKYFTVVQMNIHDSEERKSPQKQIQYSLMALLYSQKNKQNYRLTTKTSIFHVFSWNNKTFKGVFFTENRVLII